MGRGYREKEKGENEEFSWCKEYFSGLRTLILLTQHYPSKYCIQLIFFNKKILHPIYMYVLGPKKKKENTYVL